MSKTNDNNQPVAVGSKQPQAAPPTNEVFIRVGTTLYKVVDQPNISGGKIRKRIPWNMETLRQDYGVFQEGGSHLFGDIDFTDVFVRNGEWFYEVLLSHIRDYRGRKNLCSTPTPNAGTIRG